MEEAEPDRKLPELRKEALAPREQRLQQADPGNRLIVAAQLFERTMEGLRARSDGWRESAAVWAGRVRGGADWVAERVYFHHELCDDRSGPLFLELSETAKFRLYENLARDGLRVVALIHTHPDDWVGLSRTDRGNQISSRTGFWSIVVPWYAREPWGVTGMGVHVRVEGGWHRLSEDSVARRFIVEG
jgi:hypothetical protein